MSYHPSDDRDCPDDQPDYRQRCMSHGCENSVTFDFDAFCGECLQKHREERQRLEARRLAQQIRRTA